MASNKKALSPHGPANGTAKHEADVNAFFEFIVQCCSKEEYQNLRHLWKNNEELKNELNAKTMSYDQTVRELGERTVQLGTKEKQVEKLEESNADLESKIGLLKKEVESMKQARSAEQEKFMKLIKSAKDLETTKQKLNEVHEATKMQLKKVQIENEELTKKSRDRDRLAKEIGDLRSYNADMLPCTITKANSPGFANIYIAGCQWAKDFLFQELDENTFSQKEWEETKSQEGLEEFRGSLAASNSLAAMKVRFAAGLSVLGRALERYIFQPFYLTEEPDKLASFFSLLARTSPTHEVYVRSVLLNALTEEQTRIGFIRAQAAAHQVMHVIKELVPREKREACDSKLLSLCQGALERWKPLQKVEEQVVVDFEYAMENSTVWQPLKIPMQTQALAKAGSKNGTGQDQQKTQSRTPPLDPKIDDVFEVWPVIFAEKTLFQHGILLTGDEFKAASDEVIADLKKEEFQRRMAKRIERRATNDSATGGAESGRRGSSAAFLSSGTGGTSGGG